jgi:hypothetical protein
MAAPDVPLLNYALTLEHLENAFYREGLDEFADDELMGADALSEFGERVRMEVPDYLRTVGAHEAAHVDAITATVEDLGGTPVAEGEYDFGYTTPSEFLAVAQALENTGVAAYKGAAPAVSSTASSASGSARPSPPKPSRPCSSFTSSRRSRSPSSPGRRSIEPPKPF